MSVTELQFQIWIATFFWPFLRIGGLISAAPVFNSTQVSVRWRIALAVLLTLVIAPTLAPVPIIDPFTLTGLIIAAQQIIIGLAMGTLLQMVFSALLFAGQMVAMSMGLGFAQMVDPQNGVPVPVISQYYMILITFMFLISNGHLILIDILAHSFITLPIGTSLTRDDFQQVVAWGSDMLAGGLLASLPTVAALLLVNLGLGIIGRAAPQLHILAIGFPITLLLGAALIWLSLPAVLHEFNQLLERAFAVMEALLHLRN